MRSTPHRGHATKFLAPFVGAHQEQHIDVLGREQLTDADQIQPLAPVLVCQVLAEVLADVEQDLTGKTRERLIAGLHAALDEP